jgi:diguanylate cyclase (GGDEF)-like protein
VIGFRGGAKVSAPPAPPHFMNNFAAPSEGSSPGGHAAAPASERAAFGRQFAAEIERAARYNRRCSLAILDIHHLRSANAARGRAAGDHLIAQIASLLREQLRQSDQAFRYGGDEFVIVLPETDFDGASVVLCRIRERADRLCRECDLPADVGLCYGIASFPQDAEEPKPLFLTADARLRESKRVAPPTSAARS